MGAIVPGTNPIIALGISGRTCSGKSTFIRGMRVRPDVRVISFGRYVMAQAIELRLSTSRSTLQKLGDEMVEDDAEAFLTGAIEANPPASLTAPVIVFDGIRHEKIWKVVESLYDVANLIGVSCPKGTCLQRLIDRDGVPAGEAAAVLNHPMELTAERFVEKAAITLRTDMLTQNDTERAGRAIVDVFVGSAPV